MRWEPGIIWLHVVSDALIVLAYASIPILLLKVVRKRKDISFSWVLLSFAAFILACGATHFMSIAVIWRPLYLTEGIIKLITAIASVMTAICLRKLLPALFAIPSSEQLQSANEALSNSNRELHKRSDELRASYEALEVSNAEFRQLADSMPQIVWTASADGTLDYFNQQWYDFSGFDRAIPADQSWAALVHPEDLERRCQGWYSAVRLGEPFREEYRLFDKASGSYRWHLGRARPVKDEAGQIVKWYGASTDIDDYKRVEADVLQLNMQLELRVQERTKELTWANAELRRTQTWLQAMLHSATDVSIMALDNEGVITFFNSGTERLLGYRAEEIVGKCTPYMLYPPDQCRLRADQLSAELGRPIGVDQIFLADNQPSESFVAESVYLHRDGTPIDVSLAISPMIDSDGKRLGKLAVAVDMRPRKALEQQLRQNNLILQEQTRQAEEANRAKSHFLSTMSHEIRTPLNAIMGMVELLQEGQLSGEQRRYVEVFRRSCGNLLSLVNNFLDLSKIESGRFELEEIDFDLSDLLETTLDLVRPKILEKKLVLESDISAEMANWFVGDPVRLQQILGNLLSNAVKFTTAGSIRLTVRPGEVDHNRLHFDVTDTGIGIPQDKLEKIFEDFTQAETSTSRRFGGTGLGLGICKRLVSQMGGELQVRSRLGEGSSFFFDVALARSHKKEKRSGKEGAPHLAGARALVVDDNKTNRMILVEALRAWGMQTAECEDAALALAAIASSDGGREAFDIVIVDRLLGHGDGGLDLIAKIRAAGRSVPVLMITSDSIPGDQTRVLALRTTEYAVKPVGRPELHRLVCKLLSVAETGRSLQTAPVELTPRQRDKQNLHILIVDDSEDNNFLLNEYLRTGPYELTFAENGKIAVEQAANQTFDLILMDEQMPVMGGLEAAKLIRAQEHARGRPRVPMIALTANTSEESVHMSREAGLDRHVTKPVTRKELLAAIDSLVPVHAG
jgi:PAS domain S-box-containing protein